MVKYSSTPTAIVTEKAPPSKENSVRTECASSAQTAAPAAVVGYGIAAALMVLLLLCRAQLSAVSFVIDGLEREIALLESQREKLLIEQAYVYGLDRVETYAVDELGLVKPNPDQYIYIEPGMNREITKTAP